MPAKSKESKKQRANKGPSVKDIRAKYAAIAVAVARSPLHCRPKLPALVGPKGAYTIQGTLNPKSMD